MITAVDTNVLIDVFLNDPQFGTSSAEALRRCIKVGRLVICDVVLAELAAVFPSTRAFENAVVTLGIDFLPSERATAALAGSMWRQYRKRGGTRTRVIADFLVAAHAQKQSDQLLTRDRGFYRNYFSKLRLVEPSR